MALITTSPAITEHLASRLDHGNDVHRRLVPGRQVPRRRAPFDCRTRPGNARTEPETEVTDTEESRTATKTKPEANGEPAMKTKRSKNAAM
jgi:hypothetical protein